MYLYGRFDIGEVYTSTDQIKLENLRIGYGVSLAVDFPLGPLEFGYGITRDNNDQFYFNAGLDL
jgi:outer membrane protein assembly factor BamA